MAEIRRHAKSVRCGPSGLGLGYGPRMQNENTFYFCAVRAPARRYPWSVWGTGNMGRAAIRAVDAHPA